MSAIERFIDDPVDFMQNNVVVTPEGGPFNTAGKKFFTLTKQGGTAKSVERPGAQISEYLAHPASGGDMFECYWCPYHDDEMHATTVSNLANYMFTAPMNGCSFGVGSAAADGSRRVCHINMKSQSNSWQKQNAILKGSHMGDAIVDPNAYMESGNPVLVTTFGVRNKTSRSWSFYYQLNEVGIVGGAMRRTLIGVMPIL